MEEYYPNGTYELFDENGNKVGESKGDNGYVWQSVTTGVPISVNQNGDWYIEPYLERTATGVQAHIPAWFKETDEYDTWMNTYVPQIKSLSSLTDDAFNQANDVLKGLGGNGAAFVSTKNYLSSAGVTETPLVRKFMDYMVSMNKEADGETASIDLIDGKLSSIADIAREFKDLSKEDQSRRMTRMYEQADAASKEGWTGSYDEQKNVMESLAYAQIINNVDDNYLQFGNGEEFRGLLEASAWQKFQRWFASTSANFTESSIFGLIPRALAAMTGQNLEENINYQMSHRADWGANLEGLEGAETAGIWSGAIVNIAATYITMNAAGSFVGKIAEGSSAAKFVNTLNSTVGGRIVSDFFLNDIPLDIALFVNDVARYEGDVGKALWNEEETQPLTGLPFLAKGQSGEILPSGFGPQVPGGLVMNMVGDLAVDCAIPIVGLTARSSYRGLDNLTDGGVTRLRENIAVKNLELQEKLTNIPVVGTGWQKFINGFMGAENANFIREARKSAIAQQSMTPYIIAQNLLTLKNHSGMTTVAPLYKILDDSLDISSSIKKFIENANQYGGIGKTEVSWKEVSRGLEQTKWESIPDQVPAQVKQGLLDVDRLSELKGSDTAGLVPDPQRAAEIAEIEQRLANTPDEIKDFARRFAELNAGVEDIAVKLGVRNEDWLNTLREDPRFHDYMTRQALTVGGQRAGSYDPTSPNILTKSRRGYYSENYIDPTLALSMKVEALGRAYAYNEMSKFLAGAQVAQGKVIAGEKGIDVAKQLSEVEQKIKGIEGTRERIGYDKAISKTSADISNYSESFKKINSILGGREKLSLQSVYEAGVSPEIKELTSAFRRGEYKLPAETVKAAGLTDSLAASVIDNTYKTGDTYAGVTTEGVPFSYKIEDGEIVSMAKLTSNEDLAEAINSLGGIYKTDAVTIDKIGAENAYAVNRTILFYRDEMPNLPIGPTYRAEVSRKKNVYGWIPNARNLSEYRYKVVDGHIEAEVSPVYMGLTYYRKGAEAKLKEALNGDVLSHYHPKNSAAPENVPIHETGHNTMLRLTLLEVNSKIDSGKIKVSELTTGSELAEIMGREWTTLHETLAKNALDRMGIEYNGNNWKRIWKEQADTISHYASDDKAYKWETFSEAAVDYWANKGNASPFALAIMEQVKQTSEKYSMTVDPGVTFEKNGLKADGLFKNNQYAFPDSVKTTAQKAKWLDGWRKDNPYLKQEFTADVYQKANLYDTFFQKEIAAYDSKYKTSIPDSLIKKNGDFLEKFSDNAAKEMVAEIKKQGSDFSQDLATVILSRNSKDISEAMDNLIIKKVNETAEVVAGNMEGGAIEANLNSARATLWNDKNLRTELVRMVTNLTPESDLGNITSRVINLCDEQAKGFATIEALPIEMKQLVEERRSLYAELQRQNKAAKKAGKEADSKLAGYEGDVTQVLHYKENGNDVYYVTSDPVVSSILKRPGQAKEVKITSEIVAQMMNTWATLYRVGTTTINPMALVRNVLRDPMQATIQGGFNPFNMTLSPEIFMKTLREQGLDDVTIRNVTNQLRNWAKSSTLVEEMKLGDTRVYRSRAEQTAKRINEVMTENKLVEWGSAPLDAWESMFRNQIAQQSFMKNYSRTGDVNKALASAMFDASNSTTNFSHSIGMFRRATATIPYISSAINGTASFWRQFNVDPAGMVVRISAGFMVPVMAITAWNLSNSERREQYMNLPEWFRQGHLIIYDLDGRGYAVPIPEELQQFAGTARKVIELINGSSPYSLTQILSQGALGFLPTDMDGFVGENGIEWGRGIAQLTNGLMPQAFTAIYELIQEEDLYTGADLSTYNGLNKTVNFLTNTFGTGFRDVVNSIGMLCGVPENEVIGLSMANTLARDLFGLGFEDSKNQFMNLIGNQGTADRKATGLFAENEQLQKQIAGINKEIAYADESKKAELEKKKQDLIDGFTNRVATLMNKYMQLYTNTGGLERWKKNKIIQLLTLGQSTSSAESGSYQSADSSQAYLDERGLAMQRYVNAGLPAGADLSNHGINNLGRQSIELQAAINRYYGSPKQAAQDYKNAIEKSNLKDIRNEFYDAISQIYDYADANNIKPDYDLIERIQARYLQAVDSVLVPIINQYGIDILNNSSFIDAVEKQVNGMIPSDDWRKSTKNAKKYLSSKEFPTATVNVKKWLMQRYSSSMKDRGLASDPEVTERLESIKTDIDAGKSGSAKGKIRDLLNGINKANYYISQTDYQTLAQYNNMVK